MGVFCCFVVAGGVIVKYNLNSDGKVLFDNCLGADVQNPVMRGKQLETEERKSKSRLNASGNTNRPDTEREFFQAHRSEIEFISKVGTSMLLCVKWVALIVEWALTFLISMFLFVFFLLGTSQDDHDPASKIISVDKSGRIMIWPYSRSNYSGFGWFIPSAKYKLRNRYDGGKSHKSHKSYLKPTTQ